MQSTIGYRRGDVVLVPIDFTDQTGRKLRPAIVVSADSYSRSSPDVLIASVTSNLHALPHPGDCVIQDWQAAGLLAPSLAQTKLATIEASLIRRRLGALAPADLAALEQGLRLALDLN